MHPQVSQHHYQFAGFCLDTNLEILINSQGERIRLKSKVFQTLLYLVERPGEVVDKRTLMAAVWPDVIVEENNLNQCIVSIRKALGETPSDRRFLLTIPGRGFKFIAPVTILQKPAPAIEPTSTTTLASIAQQAAIVPRRQANVRAIVRQAIFGTAALCACALAGLVILRVTRSPVTRPSEYEQLTDVAEAASAPAISSDGHFLAYILGDSQFLGRGQLYVKQLPTGEPVQLTHLPGSIYSPVFSPDGGRIAFTHVEDGSPPDRWETLAVSTMSGTPTLLLPKSSGLNWVGAASLIYSEVDSGTHMEIATSTESRAEHRIVYSPAHERGMAHFSFASPDGRSVLVVEMNEAGDFGRCRLVPFDGSSSGHLVGPSGTCMSASWSPDGLWMYFAAQIGKLSHLWRQRFPAGEPQQITFGPTNETAVVASRDGRSLIASLGSEESALWLHDSNGEHRLTARTSAWRPWLSRDGARLYHLGRSSPQGATQLLRTDVRAGTEDVLLPGFEVRDYDISPDERQIVFSTAGGNASQIWLAPIDRSAPPRLLKQGGDQALFGGPDAVFYRQMGAKTSSLHRIRLNEWRDEQVLPESILDFFAVSPDGLLVVVRTAGADGQVESRVLRVSDASLVWKTRGIWRVRWSADGKTFYQETGSKEQFSETAVRPVTGPGVPADTSADPPGGLRIAHSLEGFYPGTDPATYVFLKEEVRQNIFRIPLH